MPWRRFFAGRRDLLRLLELAFVEPGLQVLETYSRYDRDLRRFAGYADVAALDEIGFDRDGAGAALQLALWAPSIMPAPSVSRIDLRAGAVPGASFRFTVEGAGLIWLNCGGRHRTMLIASSLGHFTEAEARRKFAGSPGPDDVRWDEHRRLAAALWEHVKTLAKAQVEKRPVMAEALELHRAGLVLKESARAPGSFAVASRSL